ncbi:MAG: voltage-gated potassium channel [Acidobacteriota bacterium]|jgi:voltage-gated potassium channel|nr:voltage-gated potassium channel [Acidobacteriota bacterium]
MPPNAELTRRFRPRTSLAYSLAALAGVVAFGTAGFSLIEGWTLLDSLYMTVMTVTTVGYGPPLPLSNAGRNFAIFFMILGVGTAGYLLSTAVQSLVRSEILAAYGERRRHREMSKLKDHYIICGAGRMGGRIVREMRRAAIPFVAIESNALLAAELELPATQILIRDATLDETLIEAGIERARGLASCLPDDADNLYVVLTARTLNPNLHIVARAVEESAEPKLVRAGANRVVAPTIIGSHRMAQALLKPAVADFMDSITAESLDLGFEQVEVAQGSQLAGHKLRDTTIRSELEIVVVAIRRSGGDMLFNPSGETEIKEGDMLIAIGRGESLAELTALARGTRK